MVWLSAEDVNLFVKRDRRVLQSAHWRGALCRNWATPLEPIKIQYQKVIQPELTVPATEDEHLIVYDTRSMELSHRRLTSDNAGNVEAQLINAFLQVDEDNIRQHLESVPSSVDDYLTSIPYLTRVTHPWLWQLHFVYLRLVPRLFF